jgi:hypothetical protein
MSSETGQACQRTLYNRRPIGNLGFASRLIMINALTRFHLGLPHPGAAVAPAAGIASERVQRTKKRFEPSLTKSQAMGAKSIAATE